jgi:hypothetical protein
MMQIFFRESQIGVRRRADHGGSVIHASAATLWDRAGHRWLPLVINL